MLYRNIVGSLRPLGRSSSSVLNRSSNLPHQTRKNTNNVFGTSSSASISTFTGMSDAGLSQSQIDVREGIQQICQDFPNEYWMNKDQNNEYAGELHGALAQTGYLGICMPEDVGGSGMGISEAAFMLEAISESGAGVAGAQTIHANVYATVPIVRFASPEQRKKYLPEIIEGKSRVCFGVTEPNSGLDTLKLQTTATKKGSKYIVNGQKIWITNAQAANRMVLLARTKSLDEVKKPSDGLSLFVADLEKGKQNGQVSLNKIPKMGGRSVDANMVFFDNFEVDEADLLGEEGKGFKMVLHGMNAERCLLAGEALGLGYAALARASQYASERRVFDRPIGQNQGIQHPLAKSWCELEAAKMWLVHAAKRFDQVVGVGDGSDANSSAAAEREEVGAACNGVKYLAAEAAYKACETAVMVHGGMGYSAEYHVERYLRESLVPRLAPVSREMILNYVSQRVLGLPKSY